MFSGRNLIKSPCTASSSPTVDENIKEINELRKSHLPSVLLDQLGEKYSSGEIDFLEFCEKHNELCRRQNLMMN